MSDMTIYTYRDKDSFYMRIILEGFKLISQFLRILIVNLILSIIFLFLSLEAIEWIVFSSKQNINDTEIDNTSWNLNNYLEVYFKSKEYIV